MKKLKVTWLDGSWSINDDPQAVDSATIDPFASAVMHGETLCFVSNDSSRRILLAIPQSRLISAVIIEEAENA